MEKWASKVSVSVSNLKIWYRLCLPPSTQNDVIYTYNNYEGPKWGLGNFLRPVLHLLIKTIYQQIAEIMPVKVQKNRFLIYWPIAEKFAYLCTKIDEISWVFFHFCNASQFSAKWHIETSKATKSKNHPFEWLYHGKADKFDQKV